MGQALAPVALATDQVVLVLTVTHAGQRVIKHLSAGARNQQVGPPVMCGNRQRRTGDLQQMPRRPIEHHGIAAGNALNQRIGKTGWPVEKR